MSVVRSVLSLVGGGLAMLVLDGTARRRGRRAATVRGLLERVRPAPVTDGTLESRVRAKLASLGVSARDVSVTVEHGCVDLRGPIATRDRARLVQSIAALPGVDSVQDLLTEPALGSAPAPTLVPALPLARPPALARPLGLLRARTLPPALSFLSPLTRIVGAGAGLGLALAAISLGGLLALPAIALGLFVTRRALAGVTKVDRSADRARATTSIQGW